MAKINYKMLLFNSKNELNAKQKLVFLNGVTCEVFENGNKTVINL